jgi:tRNA(Ile2)-agmatinylcytidine synthase
MSILAIDDTDSRTMGMCTTYVGHLIADELEKSGYEVKRVMLIRLNPAAKHKTRGNAAVAIHTEAPPETCLDTAKSFVSKLSAADDDMTNPGVVVSPTDTVPESVANFTKKALTELLNIDEAKKLIGENEYLSYHMGNGRGRIGCVAAIGAWDALDDWTYECIEYRYPDVRGTERQVDIDSVFEESNKYYPEAWDTVDRVTGSAVCIPNTPGPILYGIRGDKKSSVEELASNINNLENIETRQTFVTNQGTDAHIVDVSSITSLSENTSYKVMGEVSSKPQTKEGGHVFFEIEDDTGCVEVAAFEPTKHFRDTVRNLKIGDKIMILGEFDDGTIKLEKLGIKELKRHKKVNPQCSDCNISMSSAGKNQGYRCRKCKNTADSKNTVTIDRELEVGWYEVPPCARRHIAKPLIRGGFNMDTHPFK